MHPISLEGDVAVVTGASKGIGASVALALAQAGADVVLAARDEQALAEVRATIQEQTDARVLVHRVDITDRSTIDAMVAATLEEFGRIDILVNNAGILKLQEFEEITEEDFRSVLDINLVGTFRCIQAVAPHMKERGYGRIVNVSSIAGLRGRAMEAHYSSSKGGINLLTKSMAIELARHGVNVNAVCPGYIRTPMNEHLVADDKIRAGMEKRVPQRRVGDATEMGPPVVFLASRGASYVTGTVLSVDGGSAAR